MRLIFFFQNVQNLSSKMGKISVSEIIAFELVARNTHFYRGRILFIGSQYVNKQSEDLRYTSRVKWSDPAHFLKSPGNFFLSFPCTLSMYMFLAPKNCRWDPKKYTGSLHFTLLSFLQYLNN